MKKKEKKYFLQFSLIEMDFLVFNSVVNSACFHDIGGNLVFLRAPKSH